VSERYFGRRAGDGPRGAHAGKARGRPASGLRCALSTSATRQAGGFAANRSSRRPVAGAGRPRSIRSVAQDP